MGDSLSSSLVAAQKAMPQVHKDSEANTGKFSYTYLSLPKLLETVLEVLNDHDLALTQAPEDRGLVTCLHHGATGETMVSVTPLVLTGGETPQQWGSAVTYARRYAVTALLGIAADEDDDGQAASKPAKKSSAPGPRAGSSDGEKPSPGADKPPASLLEEIDRLVGELAAIREVDRKAVIDSMEVGPLTREWRTSDLAADAVVTKLRRWAKQAGAEVA